MGNNEYYSQAGEDKYLKALFDQIGTTNKVCVEFGGGDGHSLSNTRHFINNGWKGFMFDIEPKGEDVIKEDINASNINEVFKKHKVPKEFDLLSLDIDGNDYWVWKALLYKPRVLIIEFNGTIARDVSKTIKYNPDHRWANNDYYGASFEALRKLGAHKGYKLIHQIATTNIVFVLNDIECQEGIKDYQPAQYHAHTDKGEWIEV